MDHISNLSYVSKLNNKKIYNLFVYTYLSECHDVSQIKTSEVGLVRDDRQMIAS